MRQAFVFDGIAMLVGPWHEPMDPPEAGTRVELRLLAVEPTRGSPSAAERVIIDEPVFRADLFDQTTHPPGNLRAAHFHAGFDGIEPTNRIFDDAVNEDPTGWLAGQLNDLGTLLKQCGVEVNGAAWLEPDTAALRAAIPTIVAAVEATWSHVRAE